MNGPPKDVLFWLRLGLAAANDNGGSSLFIFDEEPWEYLPDTTLYRVVRGKPSDAEPETIFRSILDIFSLKPIEYMILLTMWRERKIAPAPLIEYLETLIQLVDAAGVPKYIATEGT